VACPLFSFFFIAVLYAFNWQLIVRRKLGEKKQRALILPRDRGHFCCQQHAESAPAAREKPPQRDELRQAYVYSTPSL
jgi:hypothetical protein